MNIYYEQGIVLKEENYSLLIDPVGYPSFKPDIILISHAHRDHYNMKVLKSFPQVLKLMSPVTRIFLDKKRNLPNVLELAEGQEVRLNKLIIRAHEAGHVLGSLQYEIILKNKRIVYTGDFNLQARLVLKPAKIIEADILIIEATYGHPRYSFPERITIYRQILECTKQLIDLGYRVNVLGRTLGTAQELTTLLSFSRLNLYPAVHPIIARINRIYELYGENLGTYRILSLKQSNNNGENPIIMPLSSKISEKKNSIICTGWALNKREKGYVPLSSHADFKQLVRYARQSSPEKVFTVYGFTNVLADFLKNEYSFDAQPLK